MSALAAPPVGVTMMIQEPRLGGFGRGMDSGATWRPREAGSSSPSATMASRRWAGSRRRSGRVRTRGPGPRKRRGPTGPRTPRTARSCPRRSQGGSCRRSCSRRRGARRSRGRGRRRRRRCPVARRWAPRRRRRCRLGRHLASCRFGRPAPGARGRPRHPLAVCSARCGRRHREGQREGHRCCRRPRPRARRRVLVRAQGPPPGSCPASGRIAAPLPCRQAAHLRPEPPPTLGFGFGSRVWAASGCAAGCST